MLNAPSQRIQRMCPGGMAWWSGVSVIQYPVWGRHNSNCPLGSPLLLHISPRVFQWPLVVTHHPKSPSGQVAPERVAVQPELERTMCGPSR